MIIWLIFMIICIAVMYFSGNSFCIFFAGLTGFVVSALMLLSILIGIG